MTDLTLEVQLAKVARLDLFGVVHAVVASEEVGADKPNTRGFELAIERLSSARERCVVVGDDDKTDGEGARRLGIPFVRVQSSAGSGGRAIGEAVAELVAARGGPVCRAGRTWP